MSSIFPKLSCHGDVMDDVLWKMGTHTSTIHQHISLSITITIEERQVTEEHEVKNEIEDVSAGHEGQEEEEALEYHYDEAGEERMKAALTAYIADHASMDLLDGIDKGLRARGLHAREARMAVVRCVAATLLDPPNWDVDIMTYMEWEKAARDIRRMYPVIITEDAIKMAANNGRLAMMPTEEDLAKEYMIIRQACTLHTGSINSLIRHDNWMWWSKKK
ncbi:hypothetical protein MY4824_003875 [Beauveria thailandica]